MAAPTTGVAREFASPSRHALTPLLSQSVWTGTLLVVEFNQTKMVVNIYFQLLIQNIF